MSSVERYMDTTLPGMATEDFPVNKQAPVHTELSEGTTIEQHAKEKKSKGKGGFVKRAWKAVKRPFRRSSHETKVEAIVPDTRVSCASSDREEVTYQLSSIGRPRRVLTAAFPPKKARWDDLDVVSITSIDWSDCNNIQQNSELPADASAEDVETQEQHVIEGQNKGKEEKMKKKEKGKEEKKKEKEEKREEKKKKKEVKKEEKKKEEHEKKKKKEKEKEEKTKEKEEKKEKKKKEKEEKKKKKEKEKEEKRIKKEKEKGEKKKGKGGFFKRAWKAVKRPSHHHCHKTSEQNKAQDQHVKEEKKSKIDFSRRVEIFLDKSHRKLANLRPTRCRCSHHRCCDHEHLCCLRDDWIHLGVREQIMSTVPSATSRFLIFPEQDRKQPFRKHNPQEENDIEKKGIFKRTCKAPEHPLRRCESRMKLKLKDLPSCASSLQETTDSEQISPDRPYISVPPMFQPSYKSFYSLYEREFVTLGTERFGDVCLATRKSDGLKVAFKRTYRYYYGTSTYFMAGYTERLMNEVAMMTLLKQPPISPYIIQMLEWFQEKSETIIVMEDPGSCTVLDKIIDLHPLNEKIARVILRQAVQAAQHSIAHGVFHFNITAENILINTSTLDIKLIDFGYSMPYTGRNYYRLGDTVESDKDITEYSVPEYAYSAIAVNALQLGRLLRQMVFGLYDVGFTSCHRPTPDQVHISISRDCKRLIDWCTRYNRFQRPSLEQMLQHRWFTKE